MKQYRRLDELEKSLHGVLDTQQIDITLIVDAIQAIQDIGENPNDVMRRLIERIRAKQNEQAQ